MTSAGKTGRIARKSGLMAQTNAPRRESPTGSSWVAGSTRPAFVFLLELHQTQQKRVFLCGFHLPRPEIIVEWKLLLGRRLQESACFAVPEVSNGLEAYLNWVGSQVLVHEQLGLLHDLTRGLESDEDLARETFTGNGLVCTTGDCGELATQTSMNTSSI